MLKRTVGYTIVNAQGTLTLHMLCVACFTLYFITSGKQLGNMLMDNRHIEKQEKEQEKSVRGCNMPVRNYGMHREFCIWFFRRWVR